MSDIQLVLLMLIGKVCIYTIQKFASANELVEKIRIPWLYQFVYKLVSCNFCLGVWVYFIITCSLRVALFRSIFYCPVISELVTASAISFAVFLFGLGWNEMFSTIIIGEPK
jgi:hypothetical protein